MSYSKQYPIGQVGALSVSESAGVVNLNVSVSATLGGGQAAGIASASLSGGVSMSVKQLIDLGADLAAAKFPSLAAVFKEAQALIDAELAQA